MNKEQALAIVMESIERLELESRLPESRQQERAVLLLQHLDGLYKLRESVLVDEVLTELHEQLIASGDIQTGAQQLIDQLQSM